MTVHPHPEDGLLVAHLLGMAAEVTGRQVNDHLSECELCQGRAKQLEPLTAALDHLRAANNLARVPPGLYLRERIVAATRSPNRVGRRRRLHLAVAALLLLGVGFAGGTAWSGSADASDAASSADMGVVDAVLEAQRAGTAYAAALERLALGLPRISDEIRLQARDVTLSTFAAALSAQSRIHGEDLRRALACGTGAAPPDQVSACAARRPLTF